jgi:antitoxin MazE
MKLQVSKWGNSLAVRLPVEYTRAVGVKDGDSIDAQIDANGGISLSPVRQFDKAAFLAEVRKLRASMPMTSATVARMRRDDRY